MNTHDNLGTLTSRAWLYAYLDQARAHCASERDRLIHEQDEQADRAAAERGWFDDADIMASPEELLWTQALDRLEALTNALGREIDALLTKTGRTVEEAVEPFLTMSLPELLRCTVGGPASGAIAATSLR